ncbi:protein HEG homolog 1 isoform X1 [Enhydra lutris kenyoni]|uniref:Protein HEG homolog 1 n=1 Tax=Enhydra lutris kenyoni TaxID=391180 RepID=A0A2Y9KCY5_ENHLU|nr:protein HEG homolog 1 isoform X1 [Enhydra lutris kenyoni]
MASPPLPRPLLLLLPPLLLLLLLPPAAPGTRGWPPSPALRAPSGAPLAGAGLARPPEPGPERELLPTPPPPTPPRERRGLASPGPSRTALGLATAARRGPSRRAPRGGSADLAWSSWTESNTESHIENITFDQNQMDLSTVVSKEAVRTQIPTKNHTSSDAPENFTPQTEAADARGRNNSSWKTNFTTSPVGADTATALISQSLTRALGTLHLPSSSGSEGRADPSHTESLTSRGSVERGKGLPEEVTVHSQVAATWVLGQSPPPALGMGEEITVLGKRNTSGPALSWLLFSRTPASSPPSEPSSASGSTEELNNSTILPSALASRRASERVATTLPTGVPRMLPSLTVSLQPLNETENFPKDSEIARTSVSAHSSPFEAGLQRNREIIRNPGNGEFIEPSTENGFGLASSRVSVGFWQNDSPTFGGDQLASSSEAELGSPMSQTEAASRPVPSGRSRDSTARWFLTHSKTSADVTGSSTSYPEVVNASVLTHFSASAPQSRGSDRAPGQRNYAEPATELLSSSSSESLDSSAPRGERSITGISYSQVSGMDMEQGTSSDYTDHTYVSSTFTKGERALLSITDNSSSPDLRESSTSSTKISNSSLSDSSSSSQAQTGGRNVSSYDREYAQPSTESLAVRTASVPSYTPTINRPNTLVLLDTDAALTRGSSSSSSSLGPPLPLPSVSQSHQLFSSVSPSTRASALPLQSIPDAPKPMSSSPPPLPVSLTASTPASPSAPQTTLPPSPPTLVLPRARDTPMTSVQTETTALSVAMLPKSQTADPKNQSNPYPEKVITESKPPSPDSLPTEATEAVRVRSTPGIPRPSTLTESSTQQTLSATSISIPQTSPALTTTILQTSHPFIPVSTRAAPMADPTIVQTTAEKQLLPTSPEIPAPQISTERAVTTERSQVHGNATSQSIPLTSVPTSVKGLTPGPGVTEEYSPASHLLRTSPLPVTHISAAEVLTPKSTTSAAQSSTRSPEVLSSPAAVNSCAVNPCLHDGKCVADPTTSRGYRCRCSPSWQGDDCSVDVNECLLNPCPPLATCNNTQGSFTCKCAVGYQLEKGICSLVRTFVTEFKLKKTFLNTTMEKKADLHEVENEITKTLNMCFSALPGYTRSTVHASGESNAVVVSLQTTFSLASNVTLFDLADGMQNCANSCRSSAEVCQLLGSQRRIFKAGSLCKRKTPECDKETSICTDLDGVALCQCKSGYFQFNKMDHSCRACEDGYRLENETCMSCPFGLGGLNCGNPYQLITVVIAAAGGGLLLILGIALIVTCCRKSKNDISKLIFKSGDFQMSPYAEYPKNPRSQEWGREAIEMHENGSTKNLLQMTDVYYSPTSVRNPELERNGLYPAYTGLPGSRHSCIFPGQYNPSFISDESRRRDYF